MPLPSFIPSPRSQPRARLSGSLSARVRTALVSAAVCLLPLSPLPAATVSGVGVNNAEDSTAENEAQDPKLAAGRKRIAELTTSEAIATHLKGVVETDPALALELARTATKNDREKYELAAQLLRTWGRADLTAAWDWALAESSQFDLLDAKPLKAILLEEAAAAAPEKIVGLVQTALAPERRMSDYALEQTTEAAVSALAKQGHSDLARAAVEQWTRQQPPARIGAHAFELGAQTMGREYAAAAAWLRSLPGSQDRNIALGTLAATWAHVAPEVALNWANELSPADGREEVRMRALEIWMKTDSHTASQWLLDHESDSEADRTFANLIASTLLRTDPTIALKWAGLISDPDLRAEPIEQVLSVWAYSKPTDAIRYLQTCPLLSGSQKRRILRNLEMAEHSSEE